MGGAMLHINTIVWIEEIIVKTFQLVKNVGQNVNIYDFSVLGNVILM